MRRVYWTSVGVISAAICGSALAASVGLNTTIAVEGNKLDNFDIGYVDANAGRYYLADRSNAAVDIFDTRTNKYVGRVSGFVGVKKDANGRAVNNMSGPNGLALDRKSTRLNSSH